MTSISVVIPTYGRPAYLAEAVESVLRQTIEVGEIIVVDDASPVPIEVPRHPIVRVVRLDSNTGPAGARNAGVRASRGEIIAFLDDDDLWLPRRLEGVAEALMRYDVCVCWQDQHGRTLEGNVGDVILDTTTPSLGATAIRRAAWIELDESLRSCEDLDWWLRVASRTMVTTIRRQGLVVRRHDAVRAGYGAEQRIEDSQRLLVRHLEYFDRHPRARSQRWKSIGLNHLQIGAGQAARNAFVKSFFAHPTWRGVGHVGRSCVYPMLRSHLGHRTTGARTIEEESLT